MYLALNTSRPLFANANLRKAVNYALDRRAIATQSVQPTDQYLLLGIPGFRDTHIYPLTPDLAKAKRLARGHGGRAVLYTGVESADRELAQLIKAELAPIGITVQIKALPASPIFHLAGTRGEPFDMALDSWYCAYPDPADILNYLFDGRSIRANGNTNHSYFDDPTYNRKLAAAARLNGPRRYAAYQALEADLLRNAAPAAPLFNFAESEFFSARIGCQVYQPVYQIDLAALCLKASLSSRAANPDSRSVARIWRRVTRLFGSTHLERTSADAGRCEGSPKPACLSGFGGSPLTDSNR